MARPCRYPKDLTGIRFGRLVAQEPSHMDQKGVVWWKCLCDCGTVHYSRRPTLISGHVRSCGCLAREKWTPELRDHLRRIQEKIWTPERREIQRQRVLEHNRSKP